MAQNWIMIISEFRRYQGVSYKSDITVISGRRLDIKSLIFVSHFVLTNLLPASTLLKKTANYDDKLLVTLL